MRKQKIFAAALRYSLSLVFLWAFFDKLFGLGFATQPAAAWIHGGSPTSGFLLHAAKGPFAGFFQALAGHALVDWLFMLGLLGVGVALLFKRYVKWGAIAGSAMLFLMWLSLLPPENNPILDEHIVYIFALGLLASMRE